VGRFYPAHLSTRTGGPEDEDLAGFACLTRMKCPIVGLAKVKGAVYSNQSFDVTVVAHDQNGRKLSNFDSTSFPSLVPTVTFTAVDAPGSGAAFGTRITPGLVDAASNATKRSVKFGLGNQFSPTVRAVPTAPTAVYLRATAPENRMGTALTISSVQSDVAESEEGGIMVVNGRLFVGSALGSELLRTPVPIAAQYWNGTNWETNTVFANPTLLTAEQAVFTNCQRTLAVSGAALPSNCNSTLVKSATTGSLALDKGTTRFLLAPAGANQSGSVRIRINGPTWLPSMIGQVTIGAHRSPLIFVREMY
jgi:hypothetical protein